MQVGNNDLIFDEHRLFPTRVFWEQRQRRTTKVKVSGVRWEPLMMSLGSIPSALLRQSSVVCLPSQRTLHDYIYTIQLLWQSGVVCLPHKEHSMITSIQYNCYGSLVWFASPLKEHSMITSIQYHCCGNLVWFASPLKEHSMITPTLQQQLVFLLCDS